MSDSNFRYGENQYIDFANVIEGLEKIDIATVDNSYGNSWVYC